MTKRHDRLEEAVDDWTTRAEHPGDEPGRDRAAEEHRRYEEATSESSREDEGVLEPDDEQRRHDTPPGSEQTAG